MSSELSCPAARLSYMPPGFLPRPLWLTPALSVVTCPSSCVQTLVKSELHRAAPGFVLQPCCFWLFVQFKASISCWLPSSGVLWTDLTSCGLQGQISGFSGSSMLLWSTQTVKCDYMHACHPKAAADCCRPMLIFVAACSCSSTAGWAPPHPT